MIKADANGGAISDEPAKSSGITISNTPSQVLPEENQ